MFVKMFVVFVIVAITGVIANPLLQAIVSQTCPICEHNSLKNQIQNLLLETVNQNLLQPANNYQPYPQEYMYQNPLMQIPSSLPKKQANPVYQPHNINQNCQVPSFSQQVVSQPYCPCTQQTKPQNNPVIPGAINQILSNPTLQTILDPNTRLFNQNGREVPNNGPCNAGTPQVINNYIIVPPDLLLEDTKTVPKAETKAKDGFEERRANNRSKTGNKRRKPKQENAPNHNNGRTVVTQELSADNSKLNERNPINRQRKHRRRQKNPDIKVQVVDKTTTGKNNEENKNQNLEIKEKEIVASTTPKIENNKNHITLSLHKTQRDKENTKIENTIEMPITENINKPNQDQNHPAVEHVEKIKNQPNTIETFTEKPKRRSNQPSNNTHKRVSTNTSSRNVNPREQTVINDFKKKFPNIPEEVVRNLIQHMKQQLSNRNFGAPEYYYPQFPISYDQLFRNQFTQGPIIAVTTSTKKPCSRASKSSVNNENPSSSNQNKNTRKRTNKRNKNRQNNSEKATTTQTYDTTVENKPLVEITTVTNKIETTTVPPTTTTEKPPTVEVVTEPIKVLVASEVFDKYGTVETTTSMVIKESKPLENYDVSYVKEDKVPNMQPELGKEDVVPTIYVNELYDEYYPDFTGDHRYNSYEDLEGFSFVSLEDDRYHYTTDKSFPLEELNRERRRDAHGNINFKYPQGRYILRLKNRNKGRANARPNENRRPRPHRLRSGLDTNNVRPKIKVKVKAEDFNKPDHVSAKIYETEEKDTYKPIYKPTSNHDTEEVIQFRTPPTLEKIDFETKQINKKSSLHDDLEVKTSSYSEAKTPQYNFNKKDEKPANTDNNKQVDQIKTEYVRSKVVNYGKPASENTFSEKDLWNEEDDNAYVRFGQDKAVVLAKSVLDDFW